MDLVAPADVDADPADPVGVDLADPGDRADVDAAPADPADAGVAPARTRARTCTRT